MTLKEQLYKFETLDNRSAVIMQMSIETRKAEMTSADSPFMRRGEKEQKAILEELDQIYDDLDRHLAAGIRRQEIEEMVKAREGQLRGMS